MCAAIVCIPCTGTAQEPKPDAHAAEGAAYREVLQTLCSAEHAGRVSGTVGGEQAIAFLARRFAALGLLPMAADSLRQPFATKDPEPPQWLPKTSCKVLEDGHESELKINQQWAPFPFSVEGTIAAKVVFAGHALAIPELGIDDFAGLAVRGKVVLALRGGPRWRAGDAAVRAYLPQLSFRAKAERVAALGAVALWIVDRADEKAAPLDFASLNQTTGAGAVPMLFADRATVARCFVGGSDGLLAAQHALDQGQALLALCDVHLELCIAASHRPKLGTANVVGQLLGSGEQRDELVVLGAHHDHIGMGRFASLAGPEGIGQLHPGADDNASGIAGMLLLAQRFRERGPGNRTLVCVAFGAEELGQLGSRWFVDQLTSPRKVAAMIDLNMIGRGQSGTLVAYGTGSGAGLAALVAAHAERCKLPIELRDRSSYRADQAVFLLNATPALLFTTGLHSQYHRPSDVPERVEVAAALQIVDLVDSVLIDLVNGPRRAFVAGNNR